MKNCKKTIILIITQVFSFAYFHSQNQLVDSILNLVKKDKVDTLKVTHLNNLAEAFANFNTDTAIIMSNQALKLALKLNYKKGESQSQTHLGIFYYIIGDYELAISHYREALSINVKSGSQKEIALHLGNIGVTYMAIGNYKKSMDFYLQSLKINEKVGNKKGIVTNLCNIGIIYMNQKNYSKALQFYLKALNLKEKIDDKSDIASIIINIANVYYRQSNYSGALETYLKALKINEELGNKTGMAVVIGNIGNLYAELATINNNIAKADSFLSLAFDYNRNYLKMSEELGNKPFQSVALGNIGNLYYDSKSYKKALEYYYRSLAIDFSLGIMDALPYKYEALSKIYERSNVLLLDTIGGRILNNEEMRMRALYFYKRFMTARDTLYSEENKKQLIQKEMNFEFEKKEAAARAEQDKKDIISNEELRQKEKQRNYFIIGFVIVGLLAMFILKGYNDKRKANLEITQQKNILDEKQKEILDSLHYAKRIQKTLITNENYFQKNIKRLQELK